MAGELRAPTLKLAAQAFGKADPISQIFLVVLNNIKLVVLNNIKYE